MQSFLFLDKDGNTAERNTISQADLNAVAEGGLRVFNKDDPDGRWRVLRVRSDGQGADKAYEIDNWVPVAKVDPAIEEAARKANNDDAARRGLKVRPDAATPARTREEDGELPVERDARLSQGQNVSPQELAASGLSKHDPQLKDIAAGMHAGNALADTSSVPHDGQPGLQSSTPAAKSQEDLKQEASTSNPNQGPTAGPKSDSAKPAAPSPSVTPKGSSAPGSATAPKVTSRDGK